MSRSLANLVLFYEEVLSTQFLVAFGSIYLWNCSGVWTRFNITIAARMACMSEERTQDTQRGASHLCVVSLRRGVKRSRKSIPAPLYTHSGSIELQMSEHENAIHESIPTLQHRISMESTHTTAFKDIPTEDIPPVPSLEVLSNIPFIRDSMVLQVSPLDIGLLQTPDSPQMNTVPDTDTPQLDTQRLQINALELNTDYQLINLNPMEIVLEQRTSVPVNGKTGQTVASQHELQEKQRDMVLESTTNSSNGNAGGGMNGNANLDLNGNAATATFNPHPNASSTKSEITTNAPSQSNSAQIIKTEPQPKRESIRILPTATDAYGFFITEPATPVKEL